jgi:succinoglycan biosynthesis protein ExoA
MIHQSPPISVVIPCRNEREHIETCVSSVLDQQSPPGGFEIIVADGMSDDGTRGILMRLAAQNSALRIVDNLGKITPSGMNAALRQAKGRYIAIMGAHNRYASDYLRRSVEVLEKTGADNVGGVMICEAKTYTQAAIAAAHHSPFSVGGAHWHDVRYEGPVDTVFGGVYRREVFDKIGLFDEELVRNQDDELNLRLTRAGGKIWQSPLIKSWYRPRTSFKDLWRQYVQYGYWKVRVIQKHRMPASVRQLVPGCFVLSLTLSAITSLWVSSAAWFLATLLSAYLACNVIASCITAARTNWRLLPLLPAIFACYHFAYGYGFLRGVLDFAIFRRNPQRGYTQLSRTAAHR